MKKSDWPVKELESVKEDMLNEKFNAGLYLTASIVILGATILIWIVASFYDSIPVGIATILCLQVAYSKWKCSCTMKYYLQIIDAVNDLLNRINKKKDKNEGDSNE